MKRSELGFTLALIPLDFFALLACATAAYYTRFHPWFTAIRPVQFDFALESYLSVSTPLGIIFLIVFAFSGLYSTKQRPYSQEFVRILLACSSAMAIIFAISFFSRTMFESRFIVLSAWIYCILFVSLGRIILRELQRSLLSFGIGVKRIVLIGNTESTRELEHTFTQNPRLGFLVSDTFPQFTNETAQKILDLKYHDLIDEIFLTDPETNREKTLQLIAFTEQQHLGFRFSADLFATAIGRFNIHTYAGVPVIEVLKTPLDGWGAIYKRIFDIVGSLFFITLTSPIMIVTALAIKLDTKGPIFFSKKDNGSALERVGQGGVLFRYFKFRSMRPNVDGLRYTDLASSNTRKGPLVKIENDPRVTRVGRWIRTFSIDEFPEFFLVLRGDMSLVGPRPHLPEEVENYRPEQRKVLTIKPGITGMAQISGREKLSFDDEVRLDMHYIEHWNPWMDLLILLKTPFVILLKREGT